jgi:exonuclease III
MKVRTWNMASNTQAVKAPDRRLAWLEANPVDLLLLQEAPESVQEVAGYQSHWSHVFGGWGTAVLVRQGSFESALQADEAAISLRGRVARVEVRTHDGTEIIVVSLHAPTQPVVDVAGLEALVQLLHEESESKVWPVDVLHHRLAPLISGRRFIVGGDFNAAAEFDRHYGPGSDFFGNERLFQRFKRSGWHDARPAHQAEEPTFFAAGRRPYQLDHVWVDGQTQPLVTSWAVVRGVAPALSDHAPVEVEIALD